MAFVLIVAKALIEIAGLALLAQFLVGIFAWGRRNENPIYRLFQLIASPMTRLVRLLTPKVVLDRHIPLAAFLILVFAWIATVFGIAHSCAVEPAQASCARLHQVQ
ncbi:MAG TPA: hypothetical protein VMG60_25065 [Burkholderiaceae bacterium]|nr:hypothetical protein [Burkholderiaceae bacterium]